jgi:hypothetical protein
MVDQPNKLPYRSLTQQVDYVVPLEFGMVMTLGHAPDLHPCDVRGSLYDLLKTCRFPMLSREIVLTPRVNDPEWDILTQELVDLAEPGLLFITEIDGTPRMALIDGDP